MFDWFVSFRVNFVVSIVSMFHLFFKKYFLVVGSVFFDGHATSKQTFDTKR